MEKERNELRLTGDRLESKVGSWSLPVLSGEHLMLAGVFWELQCALQHTLASREFRLALLILVASRFKISKGDGTRMGG